MPYYGKNPRPPHNQWWTFPDGETFYGTWDEFQRLRYLHPRENRKKDWTLPDKTSFYGTLAEFQQRRQEIYDKWNREKAEREKERAAREEKRKELEQDLAQADDLIKSQLNPMLNTAPREVRAEIHHQREHYYNARNRAWQNKDASDLFNIAIACIAVATQAFDAYRKAKEYKEGYDDRW